MSKKIAALLLLLALTATSAEPPQLVYPAKKNYRMSLDESFEVAPKKGWTLYPEEELTLRAANATMRGENDRFSLKLHFFCDTPDLAQFDTPQKMKAYLQYIAKEYFDQSWEKINRVRVQIRPFAPAGRFGYAVRFADRQYQSAPVPRGEWKYVTIGIFRIGKDSGLEFELFTNSVDDDAYLELLDYVAAFAIPEKGGKDWTVDGAQAAKLATAEFAKRYPAESLRSQRPYTVVREGDKFSVHGNMWVLAPGGVAEAEIDGKTGHIDQVTHSK